MEQIAVAKDGEAASRIAAIAKLNKPDLLAKLANEDNSWRIREAAVKQLNDQALLEKIAAGDSSESVRSAAISRPGDQSIAADKIRRTRQGGLDSGRCCKKIERQDCARKHHFFKKTKECLRIKQPQTVNATCRTQVAFLFSKFALD